METATRGKRKRGDNSSATETYTVQTSWDSFCKSTVVKGVVGAAVPVITRAVAEAWLLLGVHCFRMYDEDIMCTSCASDYLKDQMLYYRALALTFRGGKSTDNHLQETHDGLVGDGLPPGYVGQERPKGAAFGDMLNAAARVMKTNFVNHVEVHFQARHEMYVRWKLLEACQALDLRYFTRSQRKRDSAVRLVRTHTLWYREARVRDVIAGYPSLADIPDPGILLLEKLVERTRLDMGEDFNVNHLGFKLRWMRFILGSMELEMRRREAHEDADWPGGKARLKMFSLTPEGGFQPTFVQLDENILRKIPLPGCKVTKECSKEDLIHGLFDVGKVLHRAQESTGRSVQSMKTNGCTVSVVLTRPKAEEAYVKRKKAMDVPESVIAVDPGRKQLVRYGRVGPLVREQRTASSGITSKRFYQEAGYTKRAFVVAKDMRCNETVSEFNSTAPTAKTADAATFKRRVMVVLQYVGDLIAFHGCKKYMKLRWNASIMRKKAIDRVCKEISGGDRGATVAFGDASISGGRGLKGPVKEIRRRLSTHHCNVVDTDEFRTSLVCSKCSHRVEEIEVSCRRMFDRADGISEITIDRIRPHALRVCSNPLCRTVWDRDVNALRNIGFLCLYKMVNGDVAPPFVRGLMIDDED